MDAGHSKAMLQFIIGPRQALNVITVKETRSKVVGNVTKMLKRAVKRPQRGDLVAHLHKESQIPFPDALTCVLLRIGQNPFRLVQEAVGVLQRWPECRRGLQSFREELLQLL
jgi:hypothetical protein